MLWCIVKSIGDINSMLADKVVSVCEYLLPAGKVVGQEFEAGDVSGNAGQSLKVNCNGKRGVWQDFATGEGGDLIDLWCATKEMTLKEALPDIKEYLGIHDKQFEPIRKQYIRPKRPRCRKPKEDVLEYLHGRGLTDDVIATYRVAENKREVIFPYLRNDELIFAKKMNLDRVNRKKVIMPISAGMEPCLFGWQAINDNARDVTICEGEIDAMSLWDFGYPALSVPFGGGKGEKQAWVSNEWEALERFETIYLCMDADFAGQEAVLELIDRLGRYRCRVVTLPMKDANECLTKGVEKETIQKCFDDAQQLSPETLRDAASFKDEVLAEFNPPEGLQRGITPPWHTMAETFMFRNAEVTALSGINSHGKSQIAGQIALSTISQGGLVCMASLEMRPRKVLRRMVRQATGLDHPTVKYIEKVFSWMAEKMYMFDVLGTAKADEILEAFEYARRRYGVRMFIVDNFTKCGIPDDDYGGQKAFIDRMTDFANKFDCHVIVLFHPRKLENESQRPGKMDVKGSGALTDMVHNCLTIWRNKKKEKEIASLEFEATTGVDVSVKMDEANKRPDALLLCDKQREGDWEGKTALWFDVRSYQYRDRSGIFKPYIKFEESEL